MFVGQYKCDDCGKDIPKEDAVAMARNGDIRVGNLRIRFAGLRIEKGSETLWDLCPDCRTRITKCVLENRPWQYLSALPASQRSLLLSTSSGG